MYQKTVARAALAVLALGTLTLTACGKEEQVVQQLEPLTLHLGVPFSASELPPAMAEAIERFQQENPHITVEIVGTFYLSGFLGSEERPLDVYLSLHYFDPRGTAEDQFAALNLEPFVSKDKEDFNEEDFFPHLLDAFRWDGELYAVPAGADVAVMYYNRDMFDALGVAYPQPGWNWQDFLGAAERLTTIAGEGEGQTGHWGFVCDPIASYLFVLQNDGRLFDDLLDPTRARFDDRRVFEALQSYAALTTEHGVMPTPAEVNRASLNTPGVFATQKAAMWIGWISSRGGEADRMVWNFTWGAVGLPRGNTRGNWVFPLGYFIPSQTDHPQEAWALVRSLSESDSLYVPARREVAQSDAFRQRLGLELAGVALDAFESENLVLLPPIAMDFSGGSRLNELWAAYERSATDAANGDITVERMMERLRERFEGQSLEEP